MIGHAPNSRWHAMHGGTDPDCVRRANPGSPRLSGMFSVGLVTEDSKWEMGWKVECRPRSPSFYLPSSGPGLSMRSPISHLPSPISGVSGASPLDVLLV